MCGITGFASNRNQVSREWFLKGRDRLTHRGPDDSGSWISDNGSIGLGHRRLSILDLSKSGHQPMKNIDKSLIIVFNGELYNYIDLKKELISLGYIFESETDTEVILQAYKNWGIKCVEKFNGMFSFSIYDKYKNIFFLARDRCGEKPLFFSLNNNEFCFSSELKALFENPRIERIMNPIALDMYLARGYVQNDISIIKGIKKLPPAHAMIFNLDSSKIKMWRYWSLPKNNVSDLYFKNDQKIELVNKFDKLLENAVSKQLQADVPVGVLLSGGVDSSIIAAIASRLSKKPIKTFTVGFDDYESFNEFEYARLIADYFKTDHIEISVDNIKPEIILKLIHNFDEPMADSSMIPTYLISELVREHCKVALGGDGGDELFGGYKHYNRLLFMKEKLGWVHPHFRSSISKILNTLLPLGFIGKNWLKALGSDLEKEVPLIGQFFDKKWRKNLTSGMLNLEDNKGLNNKSKDMNNLLERATRKDFNNYLSEDILVKLDRASMAHSLELRSPLLDFNIIEFAFSEIPSNMKATSQNRKIFLKNFAKTILPPKFDFNRKQGFSIPLAEWIKKGEWHSFFHDVLLDSQSFFDKKSILKLFKLQKYGARNQERLFSLLIFELWRRKYKIII